jgi:hypothetical protein
MLLTSLVLAPNAPLEYNRIQELVGNGYQIMYHQNEALFADRPEVEYQHSFNKSGALAWLLTSFHRVDSVDEYTNPSLRPEMAVMIDAQPTQVKSTLEAYQTANHGSFCHVLNEPLRETEISWKECRGQSADVIAEGMRPVTEFGFLLAWQQMESFSVWIRSANLKRGSTSSPEGGGGGRSEGARPISMEFEVMAIFPFCASILFVSVFVFVMERCHLLLRGEFIHGWKNMAGYWRWKRNVQV